MSEKGLVRAFLPDQVTAAVEGWESLQKAKASRWWEAFCKLDVVDSHDVEDAIAARVAAGDEKTIEAIKAGAAAALDAADSAVLPSMALTARAYARGDVPPWFMKGVLSLLSSMSAEEFGLFRDLVHLIEKLMRECPVSTRGVVIEDDFFETHIIFDHKSDQTRRLISRVHGSIHLFRELVRCMLAHETESPRSIHLEPRVISWLVQSVPASRDGNRLEYPPGIG